MVRVEGRPAGVRTATLVLPERRQAAADAVASGEAEERDVTRNGYACLPVSDRPAPELAVDAGRLALDSAAVDPVSVGLVVHAWIHHQGHDFWSPAHYVAAGVGAAKSEPIGVQQMCNGGAAALRIALDRMAAEPRLETALVTTADTFAPPGFSRWSSDYGVAYGDGATALVLSRSWVRYRISSMHTVAAPHLERMHRGNAPFTATPGRDNGPLDVRRPKKEFLASAGVEAFSSVARASVRGAVAAAMADADLAPQDPRVLALPRLGAKVLEDAYLPALDGLVKAEPLTYAISTGHLGAGDAAASLAQIDADGLLATGEFGLLLSAGAGFTWTAIVIQAL